MPIVIPRDIPACDVLRKESIFVMGDRRALSQDIRPLEIAILNLMPTKIETETQLMRMLSNSPLQVNVTLIKTATYSATNVPQKHMDRFYHTLEEVKTRRFDGLIVTGGSDFHAPNPITGGIVLGKNFVPDRVYTGLIEEKKRLDMA